MTQKELVLDLLKEVGQPMYYRDILAELTKRGVVVGGATPEATINRCSNELVKEGLVIALGAGMYVIKKAFCNMTHKEAICALLQEKGEPMHYKEITAELIERGLPISGKTPENTINRDCNVLLKEGVLTGNSVGFYGFEI